MLFLKRKLNFKDTPVINWFVWLFYWDTISLLLGKKLLVTDKSY